MEKLNELEKHLEETSSCCEEFYVENTDICAACKEHTGDKI